MPIGIQRLNASKPQPSSQIVFIKPLPGPDSAFAQDFLERIAAICHPIMKANHLSIMTLEEHEPNPEFIGRNFNAGEIIQLVLKAPYSGHWLSFRSVQMVMIHELAHCQQMNHGRDFWKVNNQFKGELRELWAKNYTGDGLWGRGQTLLSGQYDTGRNMENERMPENLCGGTFRSRRRKRRRRGNPNVENGREETYAEAKQRRITKKFGVNGQTLGGDETTRVKLEYGQKVKGNPRVANSSRGRELRVAAAAARFGQQKVEEDQKEQKEGNNEDEDDDSENDVYEDLDDGETATNLDGTQIFDERGRGMVKVCSDEDADDVHVKEEMDELQELNDMASALSTQDNSRPEVKSTSKKGARSPAEDISITADNSAATKTSKASNGRTSSFTLAPRAKETQTPKADAPQNSDITCPICSMRNEPLSLLCLACSHVLDTNRVREHWRCKSDICKDTQYINAADCGFCGVCAARRPGFPGAD